MISVTGRGWHTGFTDSARNQQTEGQTEGTLTSCVRLLFAVLNLNMICNSNRLYPRQTWWWCKQSMLWRWFKCVCVPVEFRSRPSWNVLRVCVWWFLLSDTVCFIWKVPVNCLLSNNTLLRFILGFKIGDFMKSITLVMTPVCVWFCLQTGWGGGRSLFAGFTLCWHRGRAGWSKRFGLWLPPSEAQCSGQISEYTCCVATTGPEPPGCHTDTAGSTHRGEDTAASYKITAGECHIFQIIVTYEKTSLDWTVSLAEVCPSTDALVD